MIIDCLLSVKRKFFTIADDCDDDSKSAHAQSCSPYKRLRVPAPASIDEAKAYHTQAVSGAPEAEPDLHLVAVNKKPTVEELETRMKELQETNERIKKEAERLAAKLRKIEEEDVECMLCHDMVQNPQLLPCGHSACYGCLRNWWTQPPEQYEFAEIIDTEAEADINDEPIIAVEPNAEGGDPGPEQQPHPRRRHIFSSAVNRKKMCPYCRKEVKHRPTPNLQLRTIIDTLSQDIAPLPARREAHFTRRSDLWHGIFHLENEDNYSLQPAPYLHMVIPRVEPDPGPPPPPHPDPILNQIAQAQHRREVEAAVARRERERGHTQAFENGRTVGRMEVQRQWDRERAEQARQAGGNGGFEEHSLGLAAVDRLPLPQDVFPLPP